MNDVQEQRLPGVGGRDETRILSWRPDPFDPPHPWKVTPLWDGFKWVALVEPGFVNAEVALVAMSIAEIRTQGLAAKGNEVELWDVPWIPLSGWRDVDGEEEPIPQYFVERGAKSAREISGITITDSGVRTNDTASQTDSSNWSILRAVDFEIACARPSYKADLSIVDPTGTSGSIVNLGVGYDTSLLDEKGARGRLRLTSKFEPVRNPTTIERLLGTYQDESEDRERLATVYFLSPPGVISGDVGPDWSPYVAYSAFGWTNLIHEAPVQVTKSTRTEIRLFTGLAGGIGDDIVNRQLAFLNDQSDLAAEAIQSTDSRGYFWSI
jgi:hypothetical protein